MQIVTRPPGSACWFKLNHSVRSVVNSVQVPLKVPARIVRTWRIGRFVYTTLRWCVLFQFRAADLFHKPHFPNSLTNLATVVGLKINFPPRNSTVTVLLRPSSSLAFTFTWYNEIAISSNFGNVAVTRASSQSDYSKTHRARRSIAAPQASP